MGLPQGLKVFQQALNAILASAAHGFSDVLLEEIAQPNDGLNAVQCDEDHHLAVVGDAALELDIAKLYHPDSIFLYRIRAAAHFTGDIARRESAANDTFQDEELRERQFFAIQIALEALQKFSLAHEDEVGKLARIKSRIGWCRWGRHDCG